ncbi:polyprenyl synthetase family protein [Nocardioides dongxiaopingii]|uniref:polyprenyl synthetase family protein n=1 Tax=Nocardioides dongxiaopingii TaxID=2576036 RepID=UPI0010C76393|nr:polyprenyl synthetase family protein [Nocardioides dongxiaopingii]
MLAPTSIRSTPAPIGDVHRVDEALTRTVDAQARILVDVSPDLEPVAQAVRQRAGGGKRLRAAFCLWAADAVAGSAGATAGAGATVTPGVVEAGAALEMFHLGALVHDDVMDRSDSRRGIPTVHRAFADGHRSARSTGDPELYGHSVAILTGDLCLTWADDLLTRAADAATAAGTPDRAAAARAVWELMRTQTMAGQFLDLHPLGRPRTLDDVARVVRFKSAKYTVEHPLLLGTALAGGSVAMTDFCSAFGLRVGEAFQLRDDVLGVFGDSRETGKPTLDDVREGKRTVLVAQAAETASAAQLAVLHRHLGDDALDEAGLEQVRQVLVDSGALDRVERRITTLVEDSLALLAAAPIPVRSREALVDLTEASVWRAA